MWEDLAEFFDCCFFCWERCVLHLPSCSDASPASKQNEYSWVFIQNNLHNVIYILCISSISEIYFRHEQIVSFVVFIQNYVVLWFLISRSNLAIKLNDISSISLLEEFLWSTKYLEMFILKKSYFILVKGCFWDELLCVIFKIDFFFWVISTCYNWSWSSLR